MNVRYMNDSIRVYYTPPSSLEQGRSNTHPLHYEINYCLSGDITYKIADEEIFVVPKGLVLIPKRTEHYFRSGQGHEAISINFTDEFVNFSPYEKIFHFSPLDIFTCHHYNIAESAFYQNRIESVLKQMVHDRREDPIACLKMRNSLIELLLLIREFSNTRNSINTKIGEIDPICEYIKSNYYKNIDLKSIADDHAINYAYLSTLFKQKTGISFKNYINGIRLKKTAELLSQTEMSISGICFDSGFNDLANFYRLFKKHFGVSPQKYRIKYGSFR